jgi:hypothetical protein
MLNFEFGSNYANQNSIPKACFPSGCSSDFSWLGLWSDVPPQLQRSEDIVPITVREILELFPFLLQIYLMI